MVERGFNGKSLDLASLKLKVIIRCGALKMVANVMKIGTIYQRHYKETMVELTKHVRIKT